jgi:alanine dehydrogenase
MGVSNMQTIVINKSMVEKHLTMKDAIEAVEIAYGEFSSGKTQMPPKKYMYYEKGDLRTMPATFNERGMSGVKVVNVHPDNRRLGLPSVMAVIELVDIETGFPLAIIDGTSVTNMRTGAASGVATKWLSRKDSETVAFVGAGVQAWLAWLAIKEVMTPKFVHIWSRTLETSERLKKDIIDEGYTGEVHVFADLQASLYDADIITTTTPSRTPIVKRDWVKPGAHINAIGADAKGKQELESCLTGTSTIFIDEWEQASHSGEINIPIKQGHVTKVSTHPIGEVINGTSAGRVDDNEITIFDSTGLGLQDIITAWMVYEKVKHMKDVPRIDLLA